MAKKRSAPQKKTASPKKAAPAKKPAPEKKAAAKKAAPKKPAPKKAAPKKPAPKKPAPKKPAEPGYNRKEFIGKLKRLAESLEAGKRFSIQLAPNHRVYVSAAAVVDIQHDKAKDGSEKLAFQVTWKATK